MNDWLQKNAWGLVIALVSIVASYSIYGYRVATLEVKINDQAQQIVNLNNTGVQTQIALAKIQTDIEYIKIQVNKIVP